MPAPQVTPAGGVSTLEDLNSDLTELHGDIDAHVAATDNPHQVTAAQVGLGNVNNTSDAAKPISTAAQAALEAEALARQQHVSDFSNPHRVTAAQIGAATAAQGAKAETAVQPGGISKVAKSGLYTDLDNRPPLGTAATADTTAFATAAQGAKAETAVQPGDITETGTEHHAAAPGLSPNNFTAATTGGPASAAAPIGGVPVSGEHGQARRVTGAGVICERYYSEIEPGRTYEARLRFRRAVESSDPAGDSVRAGVAWYNKNLTLLSVTSLQTTTLTMADGLQTVTSEITSSGGGGAVEAPVSAVYARLYVETFGADARTDVYGLRLRDLTDASAYSPDLSALTGRVTSLESLDAGARLGVVESATETPSTVTYETLTAAQAATIPASADGFRTLGFATAFDGGGMLYKEVGADPGTTATVTINSRFFVPVPGFSGFETRAEVAGLVAGGWKASDGHAVKVGSDSYLAEDGHTGLPALAGWVPDGDVLSVTHCGTPSALASDFKGIFEQALEDARANNWTLEVPAGNWETQPIVAELGDVGGMLNIDFAPGAKLIGASNFQIFEGNGSARSWTLNAWATAGTDTVTAMFVTDDTFDGAFPTILREGEAGGFTKTGTAFALGASVATPTAGQFVVVSAREPILNISAEDGSSGSELILRLRGGEFDNGAMGYVASQASGTCVTFKTVKNVYWDGAPQFINSSGKSVFDKPSERRGDSGLVLENVKQATVIGAFFKDQPDLGNYTTGLARTIDPPSYYDDDGDAIKFITCKAVGCGTGFRHARDGGSYGLIGCEVEECQSGFLAANVSSEQPTGRNIYISGFTGKKIPGDMLDIRACESCVINGVLVEDWGKNPDGTDAADAPLLSFGEVKHLDASGIICRFEEWTPRTSMGDVITFGNGPCLDVRLSASMKQPYASRANGMNAVSLTSALGANSDVQLDLTTTNLTTVLDDGTTGSGVVRAKVTECEVETDGTLTRENWHWANKVKLASTTGVDFEEEGTFTPTLVYGTANTTTLTDNGSYGYFTRQGNIVHVEMSVRMDQVVGGTAATGFARFSFDDLPAIKRLLSGRVLHIDSSNMPDATDLSLTDISDELLVTLTGRRFVEVQAQDSGRNSQKYTADNLTSKGDVFLRADFAFSYTVDNDS